MTPAFARGTPDFGAIPFSSLVALFNLRQTPGQ